MRVIVPVTWLGLVLLSPLLAADFQPGQYDDFALEHLRNITQAVPLRTTTVHDVAPEFVVEKVDGLAWEAALAEADRRFGERQPERALFLRKYLTNGALESRLEDLHWPDRGPAFQSGRNACVILEWHGPEKAPKQNADDIRFARIMEPVIARIDTVVADHKLTAVAALAFPNRQLKGVSFEILSFDENDRLAWAEAEVSTNAGGPKLQLSCHARGKFGEPGINSYMASFLDPSGTSETLDYDGDLVLQKRWVQQTPWKMSYHEIYEQGRLRKRVHEDWRRNPDGSYTNTVENYP